MASIMLITPRVMDSCAPFNGVLTGIGFLGAGVIMHAQGKDEVHGLTTAASIWISAIVGVVCGAGQFFLATASICQRLVFADRWSMDEWEFVCWLLLAIHVKLMMKRAETRVTESQGSESSLTSDRNQDGTHAKVLQSSKHWFPIHVWLNVTEVHLCCVSLVYIK